MIYVYFLSPGMKEHEQFLIFGKEIFIYCPTVPLWQTDFVLLETLVSLYFGKIASLRNKRQSSFVQKLCYCTLHIKLHTTGNRW